MAAFLVSARAAQQRRGATYTHHTPSDQGQCYEC
ncbi:hypothetical protein CPT_Shaeky_069 [Streptomyces phage Shaeky]|uniref:Uncharacterized protein n=1 Tax=Streptomyces phage Shaeky TaxID=2767586 RepID=A0A873WJS5_9CAUD|nr:hypothetical protein CPT_Shaeky_069 [Streptomyces phage Shaeky]